MKTTSLNFYDGFKCKAGECKHSCCTLWNIDIDKKSLVRYRKMKGNFKKRIEQGVDFEHACFKKNGNGCAFLNNDNLCELIINKGEGSLCQVCRDHPRYRNYFNTHIEMGYGICCEVALNKVIDFNGAIREDIIKKGFSIRKNNKIKKEVLKTKEKIFAILEGDARFYEKIDKILTEIGAGKEVLDFDFKKVFSSIEVLDDNFIKTIGLLEDKLKIKKEYKLEKSLNNLLYYFIHRHLSGAVDGLDIKTRVVFSLISVLIIENVSSKLTNTGKDYLKELKESAREYSVEIEYSDENYYMILDKIDELIK